MAAMGEPMLWRTMDKMLLVVDGDSFSNKKSWKPVFDELRVRCSKYLPLGGAPRAPTTYK